MAPEHSAAFKDYTVSEAKTLTKRWLKEITDEMRALYKDEEGNTLPIVPFGEVMVLLDIAKAASGALTKALEAMEETLKPKLKAPSSNPLDN